MLFMVLHPSRGVCFFLGGGHLNLFHVYLPMTLVFETMIFKCTVLHHMQTTFA